MIRTSNLKYTRAELNKLYIEEQILIRHNSINKIIDHFIENILIKAKQGEVSFSELFPKNKMMEIQEDIREGLTKIFPDSEISFNERDMNAYNSMKCIAITIVWSLQDV